MGISVASTEWLFHPQIEIQRNEQVLADFKMEKITNVITAFHVYAARYTISL